MTTTLRPAEPLQHHADGTRARRYQVCVNGRPVGAVHLATGPDFGDTVARLLDLRIEEPDRRRGRGTAAALAAEEVARGWGCARIETSVPAEVTDALGLARVLGYVPRARAMEKTLTGAPSGGPSGDPAGGLPGAPSGRPDPRPPALPEGSHARPMTKAEFEPWEREARRLYALSWMSRGVPEAQAYAKAERDHARLLPGGQATENMLFTVLEHEGIQVGILWLVIQEDRAYILRVATEEAHRGRGHGRSLMLLAERQALAAHRTVVGLNVFAGNTPAERLYESLGYRTVTHHLVKPLL